MIKHSRGAFITISGFVLLSTAWTQTLPTGGHVTGGSAAIVPITPSLLTVQQSSNRAVINWNTFSISHGARVDFQQPNSSAAALNLVTGAQASMIDGQLTGNGRVYLLNPSGVLIGATGQVNTGSFLAAAASTTSAAAGAWEQGSASVLPLTAGSGAVTVQSGGQVAVSDGGYLGLAGPSISNNGLLYARLGKVQIAGGSAFTLDFAGDGLLSITTGITHYAQGASASTSPVSVGPSGQISAEGGTVSISAQAAQQLFSNVIGIDGQVWAQNATQTGNVIVLSSSGGGVRLGNTGRLDAGSTGNAGSIAVSADSITLDGQSVIATTGATGGGMVTLTAPTSVAMSSGSQILTNSTTGGAGGSITVSGPAATRVGTVNIAGSIVATAGGSAGTDAGGSLKVTATELDFSAPFFTTRPATGAAPVLSLTSGNSMGISSVGANAIGVALAGGADATLTAGGSITITGDVNGRPVATAAIGGAFTLNAAGDVLLSSGVISAQGSNINVSAGGVVTMQPGASLQAKSAAGAATQPSVNISGHASCAASPTACTMTITDVQAGGGLNVSSPNADVVLAQSLGVAPTGAASSTPTLGSLTIAGNTVELGQPLAAGAAPTQAISVVNAISVTGTAATNPSTLRTAITAAADLQSATGAITLNGGTTLQAGVYANGAVTFNGDLILDPHRLAASPQTILYKSVNIGSKATGTETPYPSPTTGGTPFFAATTVAVAVFQTTISSGGKGSITFGGNVGLSPTYTSDPNPIVSPTYLYGVACQPCLTPVVNLVVDAGTNGVAFSHGLANYISAHQADYLVETNYPPTFGDYFGLMGANTVHLIESSGGPPTIGAPGGVQATLWVNAFTLNGYLVTPLGVMTPTPSPLPANVSFVFPQKVLVGSAQPDAITGLWEPDGGQPPASSDSSASGVPLMPLPGTGGAGGLGGNTSAPPATIGGSPPGAPPPPVEAPSTPLGSSASAAASTSPTVTGWDVGPTADTTNTNSVPETSASIPGGRGIAAEADLGRNSSLNGAPADVFNAPRQAAPAQPCAAKHDKGCGTAVDSTKLNSDTHP